jgi:hypothetical protein
VAPSLTATKPTEPPKSQPAEPPKPAPPRRLAHRVWHEKYGLGRLFLGSESEDGLVEVLLDCQMEAFFNPADLKLFTVSHPEHGLGNVMAVGGAEYGGYDDLHPVTDEELAELADGELVVEFWGRGKRRVNAAEVITTNLCGGKAVARAAPPPMKAPWFEPGASVSHREHAYSGCIVLGSESLADNDGKVLVQFDDELGGGHGAKLFIDPAELKLRRIWHPELRGIDPSKIGPSCLHGGRGIRSLQRVAIFVIEKDAQLPILLIEQKTARAMTGRFFATMGAPRSRDSPTRGDWLAPTIQNKAPGRGSAVSDH